MYFGLSARVRLGDDKTERLSQNIRAIYFPTGNIIGIKNPFARSAADSTPVSTFQSSSDREQRDK